MKVRVEGPISSNALWLNLLMLLSILFFSRKSKKIVGVGGGGGGEWGRWGERKGWRSGDGGVSAKNSDDFQINALA